MSLARWFPRPTPVMVGGSPALASCLRVRDLAALEAFVAAALVSPLHGLDESAEDYMEQLKVAYDLAAEWPPPAGSEAGKAVLEGTVAGLAFFLAIVLRKTPGLDADALARRIATDPVAFAEFEMVLLVAWGVDIGYRARVVRALDRRLGLPDFVARADREFSETITWSKAVSQLVCGDEHSPSLPWATPEAVGDLELTQFRMVRSGGEAAQEPDPLPADPELADRVNRARWPFFHDGKPMPEAVPDEDAHLTDGPPPELTVSDEGAGEWEKGF